MAKVNMKKVQDLVAKINNASVEALSQRPQWIAKLKDYAKHPEELEDNAARFAEEIVRTFFR